MNQLTIDLEDVVRLEADGKTFVFNPDAEESIAKLLALQEQVENALSTIKQTIGKQGTDLSSGFTGVRGSKVQASYRHYGQPYKLDVANIGDLDPKFYSKSVTYRPNTKNIEDYQDSTGVLPTGVIVNEREKVVSIKAIS